MVRAESKHLNIAPNNINLPILEKKSTNQSKVEVKSSKHLNIANNINLPILEKKIE